MAIEDQADDKIFVDVCAAVVAYVRVIKLSQPFADMDLSERDVSIPRR